MATNKSLIFVLLNLILLFSLITAIGCGSDKILMAKSGVEESAGVEETTQDAADVDESTQNPTESNPEGNVPATPNPEQNQGINLVVSMDFSEGESGEGKNLVYVPSSEWSTKKEQRFSNTTINDYLFEIILDVITTRRERIATIAKKSSNELGLTSANLTINLSNELIDGKEYIIEIKAYHKDVPANPRYKGDKTFTVTRSESGSLEVAISMRETVTQSLEEEETTYTLNFNNAPYIKQLNVQPACSSNVYSGESSLSATVCNAKPKFIVISGTSLQFDLTSSVNDCYVIVIRDKVPLGKGLGISATINGEDSSNNFKFTMPNTVSCP